MKTKVSVALWAHVALERNQGRPDGPSRCPDPAARQVGPCGTEAVSRQVTGDG